jgi:hypothetical protein
VGRFVGPVLIFGLPLKIICHKVGIPVEVI